MKADIDALMQARQLDAILVTGPGDHNPALVYLTGGAHLTHADLIKLRGAEPVLYYHLMERDEAASTGLATRCLDQYPVHELVEEMDGDLLAATAARYAWIFTELGLTSGRVALFGQMDAGAAYGIFSALQAALPELVLVGEIGDSLLMEAMATKDAVEVERIRRMGHVTVEVVGQVAEFLTSHHVLDQFLVKADGRPLTVGEVKHRINFWLAERGAENPEGTIFAIGRAAGIPHSAGLPTDLLRLGQTIVFDIFPCEASGGYYYDFTRTWCLGYASDETQALYEDVLAVYHQLRSELRPGMACPHYQLRACELFEARGHPTICSNPQTQEGYVHGLGHGLGLHVHQRPWFRTWLGEGSRLEPGVVVTLEPGLYYPERGMGVRLEDTLWVRPDGQIEVLVEYPMELVLPMAKA